MANGKINISPLCSNKMFIISNGMICPKYTVEIINKDNLINEIITNKPGYIEFISVSSIKTGLVINSEIDLTKYNKLYCELETYQINLDSTDTNSININIENSVSDENNIIHIPLWNTATEMKFPRAIVEIGINNTNISSCISIEFSAINNNYLRCIHLYNLWVEFK
jgi:hypothetical protein